MTIPQSIAFVGGRGHHYLARVLAAHPDARPSVAVASDGREPDQAKRLAERLGCDRYYDDAARMMDEFQPRLLSIGAVYGLNGKLNAQALERGIPTVSDKPIAATWDDLRRLVELHRKNPSVPLLTEFPFRAQPEFVAARAAIARGDVGPVVLMLGQKSYRFGTDRPEWYGDRASYAGTIAWVASHAIDAVRYLSGLPWVAVTGRHGNVSRAKYGSMEDHAALVFEMAGGATAVVTADFLNPAKSPVHGDEWVRVVGGHGVVRVGEGKAKLTTDTAPPTDLPLDGQGGERASSVGEALLNAVAGHASPYGTAASFESAIAILAARDAADTRKTVDLFERFKDLGVPWPG